VVDDGMEEVKVSRWLNRPWRGLGMRGKEEGHLW